MAYLERVRVISDEEFGPVGDFVVIFTQQVYNISGAVGESAYGCRRQEGGQFLVEGEHLCINGENNADVLFRKHFGNLEGDK